MARTELAVLQHTDPQGRVAGLAVVHLDFQLESDGRWTGECRELGTAAYGGSFDDTHHQLLDAILLQLSEVDRLGHIEAFLRDRNVELRPPAGSAGRWDLVSMT